MKTKIIILGLLMILAGSNLQAQYEPDRDGWNFYNFLLTTDTTTLWTIYSKAFLGVGPDYASASVDDQTFFDLVITRYAGNADCFGMSLLSLICYKEGGHLGVCSPVYDYEGDLSDTHSGPDMELVREAIGVMHLRQLTQPMLEEIVDMVNNANYTQPTHHFGVIKAGIASGDYPMLSFMPSSISTISGATGSGQQAHTIVPISTTETATYARIYVYDPNRPYSQHASFYDGATAVNYLEIDLTSATKHWKYPADFNAADPNSYGWEGGSNDDWTFIATNISTAKYKDNHALSASWILGQIGTLIFSGEGGINQISDDQGHTFYNWSSGTQKLEKDPARRTMDIIRWPFFAGRSRQPGEVYFFRHAGGKNLNVEVNSKGQPYTCRFLLQDNSLALSVGSGGSGKDTLRIEEINTAKQTLQIGSQRDLSNVRLNIHRRYAPYHVTRDFTLSNMNVAKEAPVRFALVQQLDSLQVESPKSELIYNLQIAQTVKNKTTRSDVQQFVVPAGQAQTLSPMDWQDLKKNKLESAVKAVRKIVK